MTHVDAPENGNVITDLLQAAIDRTARAGGGRVTVPQGRWVAGAIRLRSGIELHVPRGATLACSRDYADFAAGQVSVVAEDSDRGFLVARDAEDISITGKGVIHGGGPSWCSREGLFDGVKWAQFHRPRMVVFEACRAVEIRDVTFLEAPMWTVHLVACDGVRITDLTILNDMLMPNTDGVNFDSCRDVFMSGCKIVAADDSVCVKTCAKLDPALEGPAERIHVTNCHFTSRSCSVKIGTETHQDVRDVVFSGLTITGTNRALASWRAMAAQSNASALPMPLSIARRRRTPIGDRASRSPSPPTPVCAAPCLRLCATLRCRGSPGVAKARLWCMAPRKCRSKTCRSRA